MPSDGELFYKIPVIKFKLKNQEFCRAHIEIKKDRWSWLVLQAVKG
jgi:hypothetical protein